MVLFLPHIKSTIHAIVKPNGLDVYGLLNTKGYHDSIGSPLLFIQDNLQYSNTL